jgi:tetratricopeptide (TPR) repeat protein
VRRLHKESAHLRAGYKRKTDKLSRDAMIRNKPQNEPYKVVYDVSSLIGGAAYLYILIIFSSIITYLIFFVPLSYQKPDQAHEIWQVGGMLLLIIAVVSGVFYISLKIIYKRNVRWLGWIAFISNWISLCIVFTLNFLGLYPVSIFMPSILLAFSLGYFLFEQLYLLSLRYNHYLSRAVTFSEQGAIFLALICATNFILLLGLNIRSILSLELNSDFILSLFMLIGLGILIYFAVNIDLNDPRSSKFKTIVSVTICFSIVIALYFIQGYISFWWLGIAALSSSIFYTAHSPTRLKSSGAAIGLYSAMSIAVFLDNVTFAPSASAFWSVMTEMIFPTLGIVIALIAGGGSVIKTIFPKFRSHRISKYDVKDASNDFFSVHGYSVNSIDQVMKIAVLTKDFDFCEALYNRRDSFGSTELREYFEIYYLCVIFTFRNYIFVMSKDDEQVIRQVSITTTTDFINYINLRFPILIRDYEIWRGYATKGYITKYINEEKLKKACPETSYSRLLMYLRNAFIILLVFLAFSSQVLTPWLNSLPTIISRLASWNSVRKNEIRLVLSMAFKPIMVNDSSLRNYYAISMWNWSQNRELYSGEQRNGHFYMPKEIMESQIIYLETIFTNYKTTDDFYYRLSNEIGGYYQGLSNCNKALFYFEEVLANSLSVESRDFAIAMSAECYRTQDLQKAIILLQEGYQDIGYIQSRSTLADIYFGQENYDEVVNLLTPISDFINPRLLSLLGESLFHVGMYNESKEILKRALTNDSLISDDNRRIHSYLFLATAYLETDEPFYSAEYFFKAFSEQICPYTPVLSSQEEEVYIQHFKSAIDSVSQKNPDDRRTNLWNFVYFLYSGEPETAIEYFKANLVESPEYERKFSECVLNMIESK